MTGIKQSTLRYFDDMGLFSPAARGENGYRYYTPQQIITINSIKLLNELNMPIKRISELERNRTPERLLEVLNEKESELDLEYYSIQKALAVVRTLRKMIQTGLNAEVGSISVTYLEELPIVIGQENSFEDSYYFFDPFMDFCRKAGQYRIDLRLPVGGMFDSFESFSVSPSEPNHFFSVDPSGIDKRAAGKYLTCYGRGYYGETGDLVERMSDYIARNSIKTTGPVYMIYLHDELSVQDADKYLYQAVVMVE